MNNYSVNSNNNNQKSDNQTNKYHHAKNNYKAIGRRLINGKELR